MFGRHGLRLPVYPPPGAAVEIELIEDVPLREAGIQRHAFRQVRMAEDDVPGAAIAKIGLGHGMMIIGIAGGAADLIEPAWWPNGPTGWNAVC